MIPFLLLTFIILSCCLEDAKKPAKEVALTKRIKVINLKCSRDVRFSVFVSFSFSRRLVKQNCSRHLTRDWQPATQNKKIFCLSNDLCCADRMDLIAKQRGSFLEDLSVETCNLDL